MSITPIDIGNSANDGRGMPLRDAFARINSNTSFLASQLTGGATKGVQDVAEDIILDVTHVGSIMNVTSSSAINIAIPSLTFSAGDTIQVITRTTGGTTIAAADSGVTVNDVLGGFVTISSANTLAQVHFLSESEVVITQLDATTAQAGTDILQPFTVDTLVMLGASITEDMFETPELRNYAKEVAEKFYGVTLQSVAERGTAGHDIAAIKADLPGILSAYTGQQNVVFFMHASGNNITYGTEYDDLPQAEKDAMIADYNDVLDLIEAEGHKVIPFGLTYRHTNGVDSDPSQPKSNELHASWTYNAGWIQPIIAARYPKLIRDNKLSNSLYEYTRSVYDVFLDGDHPNTAYNGDLIHPNECGDVMGAGHIISAMMDYANGRYPEPFEEVNFNEPFTSPVTPLDVVISPHISGYAKDNNNINWVEYPYGNADSAGAPYQDKGYFHSLVENPLNTDGSVAAIKWMMINGTGIYPTSVTGSDVSNSLLNTNLRKYCCYGFTAGMITGLEPNKTYEASLYYISGISGSNTTFYCNDASGAAPDGTTKLFTQSMRSDPLGRVFYRISGSSRGISGMRLRSI